MEATTTTLQADSRLMNMARQANAAGCPRQQVENFIKGGYIPWPTMLPFHAACRLADKITGPIEIALGGSRGPGKSHAVMAQVALDDCQRVSGLKVLFLRKVMKSAAESLEDLAIKVLRYTPHILTNSRVTFPNGSRILLGGYNNERVIEKYLGIEYDIIVLEEATQISEGRKDKLDGSRRSTKPGWRERTYLDTNADGIGLLWFKRRFVKPWREGMETDTRFFDVSFRDNPLLSTAYVNWLKRLKGPLGKAWRDSDWDAFAGMAFPMWNHERHVIKAFEIPTEWPRWRAVDWGSAAPFCCLWFTKNPDTNRVYVYREAYATGLTDRKQTDRIHDLSLPGETFSFNFADPALWQKKNYEDVWYSTADKYREYGVPLTKADNDRLSGKRKVDEILSDAADGEPGLLVFENCEHLIEQLESLSRDELNIEDVDTNQEDHAYDTLKYGLTNIKAAKEAPAQEKEAEAVTNQVKYI